MCVCVCVCVHHALRSQGSKAHTATNGAPVPSCRHINKCVCVHGSAVRSMRVPVRGLHSGHSGSALTFLALTSCLSSSPRPPDGHTACRDRAAPATQTCLFVSVPPLKSSLQYITHTNVHTHTHTHANTHKDTTKHKLKCNDLYDTVAILF